MDHDLIVEQLLAQCTGVLENIVQATDLHRVAAAPLAIFAPMGQVGRAILQAKIPLEAQPIKGTALVPSGQDAGARDVRTRTVSPQILLGEVRMPVRTFQCRGCGASIRSDDHHWGVPEVGDCTADVRGRSAPVVAALPH